MRKRQVIYLLLAAAGILLTGYHNYMFVQETGSFSLVEYVRGVNANHAAASIGWDIAIACAAFITWMIHEARRIGMPHVWVYIVLTFTIAFAFACPLFLYMRDRHLQQQQNAS